MVIRPPLSHQDPAPEEVKQRVQAKWREKESASSHSNLALSNQSLNDEGDSDINELVSVEF